MRSTNQHLWSVEIGISISLIVEISIFDRWNLHRWCNCKQCICWSWDRMISISDPLTSASASLWLLRSAYFLVESCIADAITSNVLLHVLRMRMCVVHFMCWLVKDGLHGSPMLVCMWPWSQPFGQWLCVAFVSVFDLTHEHLVMGNCTHGVWHNSMCDIVCADGVHATHMRAWVRTHCLRMHQKEISTIKYADLNDQRDLVADFKDQRCWFVDLNAGTIFSSINKYNAMWSNRT